jgi:RNA polymerase sigma factor (sigma-70 family)
MFSLFLHSSLRLSKALILLSSAILRRHGFPIFKRDLAGISKKSFFFDFSFPAVTASWYASHQIGVCSMDLLPASLPERLSPADASLALLIQETQAGSSAAAQALFDRCRTPLLAVIRHVIQPRLRQLCDSDDFLNEAFIEIFTTYFTDEILRSPETLWPYLKRIAENKVRDANRKYLHSQRYNINRTVSLESLEPENREECLWANDLSPEEALILKELVEDRLVDLVSQLPTLMQKIVRLLLDGAKTWEIAHRLGVKPKHVYRAMDWLKRKIRE